MITAIIGDRCIDCGACAAVCPTNVFDFMPESSPVIARLDDCQTCFLCELHCPTDALYVDPDCEAPAQVDLADLQARGLIGKFKRDSGWGHWEGDPRYPNEHWRMDNVFKRAAMLAVSIAQQRTPSSGSETVSEPLILRKHES